MSLKKSALKCIPFSLILIIILSLLSYGNGEGPTHKLDTAIYHFQLENNSRITFSSAWIYLGDSNGLWTWIENDGIKFYNLEVDSAQAPNPWEITVSSNTNITIDRLFKEGEVDLSIIVPQASNSSLEFSCGSRGAPHSVTGLNLWDFNDTTSFLNLTAEDSGSVLISWMGPYYYWPEPNQPTIPIMMAVELPPVFHPSFMEFLTDRISIGFTIRIVNEDTVDHTLGLTYQIFSETGEIIQEEALTLELQALSEKTLLISKEIPFHKRNDPKEYTATVNLTRDGKLIMDPISHTLRIEHSRIHSLLYTLIFLGGVIGLLCLGYGLYKYWPEGGR